MKTHQHSSLAFAVFALASLLALVESSSGATDTWIGNTSNSSWSVGANWSGGSVPTTGDTLVFGASGSSGLSLTGISVTLGGSGTDGIDLTTSAPSYTMATGTLTLSSSGGGIAIKDLSSFAQTFSNPLTLSSDQTFQIGATTGAPLSVFTNSGAITGGFRLTKTGYGNLILASTANALTGLTVNGGIVSVSADSNLSAAPGSATPGWIVLNGGALRNATGITINANRGIALGSSTAGSGGAISVTSGNMAYNGIIANSGGTNYLTKTGTANLILGGANTYTGETRIDQGKLSLDFSVGGAPASNIVNSSSALVMGGLPTAWTSLTGSLYGAAAAGAPILFVQASGSANGTQTFNGVTVAPGYANLAARGNGTFNATVALGAISHTAGGTANFSLLTSGSTGQGNFTTTTSNTNGILGGWATTAATSANGTAPLAATDWATNVGGNIVAYTGYTVPTGAAPVLTSNATSNIRLDSTSTGNATLSAVGVNDLNTIQMTDSAARLISIGAGNTLRLGASGGVWAAGTGALTINVSGAAGTLTSGGATDQPGEIVFNTGTGTGTRITVNAVIANNGNGTVSVVKTGAPSMTLSGGNLYTGGTTINQGQISANNIKAFGTGDVTVLPGAAVQFTTTTTTFSNNFNIAGSGALILGGNTLNGTVTLLGNSVIGATFDNTGGAINGQITGDYSLGFLGGTGAGAIYTLSNTGNNYTGDTSLSSVPADPTGASPTAGNITLKMGAANALSSGVGKGNLIMSSASTYFSKLDLNGNATAINGLISGGAGTNSITNTSATAATLTVGNNDQTATYGGTILAGTGSISIVKTGAGTQTFSGTNSYTGSTMITVGTLVAQADKALGDSSSVSVNGGTLDIRGATAGTVTLGANAGLSLSSGIINFQLGTSFDQLVSSGGAGAFTITGGTFALDVSGTGFSYANTYAVLSGFGGANSVTGLGFTGYDSVNYTASLGTNGVLSFVAVPEPATWALIAGAGTFFMVMRRRRFVA